MPPFAGDAVNVTICPEQIEVDEAVTVIEGVTICDDVIYTTLDLTGELLTQSVVLCNITYTESPFARAEV